MAPAKNAENTTFSCQCMSADELTRNHTATTINAINPAPLQTDNYSILCILLSGNCRTTSKSQMPVCVGLGGLCSLMLGGRLHYVYTYVYMTICDPIWQALTSINQSINQS